MAKTYDEKLFGLTSKNNIVKEDIDEIKFDKSTEELLIEAVELDYQRIQLEMQRDYLKDGVKSR